MKSSLIAQLAAIALALSVTASPIAPRQTRDDLEAIAPTATSAPGELQPDATKSQKLRKPSKTKKMKTSKDAGPTGGAPAPSGGPGGDSDDYPPNMPSPTGGLGGGSGDNGPPIPTGGLGDGSGGNGPPFPTNGTGGGQGDNGPPCQTGGGGQDGNEPTPTGGPGGSPGGDQGGNGTTPTGAPGDGQDDYDSPSPTGGAGGGQNDNEAPSPTGGAGNGPDSSFPAPKAVSKTKSGKGKTPSPTKTPGSGSGDGQDENIPTTSDAVSMTKSGGGSAPSPTEAPGGGSDGGSGGGSGGGGSFPKASATSALKAAQTVAAGQSFDGKMAMFDRGVKCTGQAEGGDKDAVFILEEGASISNVIIGPNQIEGIHCNGACTVTNVWWDAVCEDAFTVKKQADGATTTIKGGGARGAEDKVVQHNGGGTISISDFVVEDFGKLYRSCGNCAESHKRNVIMSGITAKNGKLLAGINSNFGDTAKITNSKATGVKNICTTFKGVSKGSEPTEIGSGNDGKNCIYGADVTSN